MITETSLISEGDRITNDKGLSFTVLSVEQGQYGLLVKGEFDDGNNFEGFLLYEPPSLEVVSPWYGWARKAPLTLANGIKLGEVCLWTNDPRVSPEEYDKEWERTIEAMRREECEIK